MYFHSVMNMKKRAIIILTMMLTGGLIFDGCSSPTRKDSSKSPSATSSVMKKLPTSYAEDAIMYSNLTDDASRKEVIDILQERGISKEQTDTLLAWVDDFNKRVDTPLSNGFLKMTGSEVDYSEIVFSSKETEDGSFLPEANCRLTSFLLMRDLIQTDGKKDESDTYLMFDVEAIETAEQFQSHKEKIANYYSLFNWISVKNLKTVEQHTKAIQKAWKDRGIQIDSSKGISLVNVYMHTIFEDVRIVGHTGVLFDLGDKLLFVEKYGPEAPFMAIWFHNRTELQKYVLARKDLYGDKEEVAPIVMENDQLMKTE
jgi:hypothetical protein